MEYTAVLNKREDKDIMEHDVVGKRVPNVDSNVKVTGRAIYASDLNLPEMLFGKILRSPYPHARIKNIDVSEAKKLPGVCAVVTAEDTLKINYLVQGPPFDDKPVLAYGKTRYIGDEVAAVAAVDERTALRALDLIKIEYEPLPAVFDPEEAMKEGAPVIHDNRPDNISARTERNYGNVEKAFAESDYVFEDRYVTQAVSHCCLETRASLARWDSNVNLEIWSSTQSPYFVRKELAHVFAIPPTKVRVHQIHVGGGFGARSKVCEDEGIAALLALKTGRPVKITYTREEELTATRIRHPMIITLKTGVRKDGTLLARHMRIITDNGAYTHTGPGVQGVAGMVAASLYRVPNVRVEGYLVYTNKHFGGPFRGYGNPQATFAIESQMDLIATKLNIDPIELRIRNANQPGDTTACGWKIGSCALQECLERVREEIKWEEKKKNPVPGRGIGVGCMIHASGFKVYLDGEWSSAIVKVTHDGMVEVYCGATDMGTWSKTSLAQVASEELGIPVDLIKMITMDTETTPIDLGAWGSRTIFIAGNAVKMAAAEAKQQLLEAAGKLLEVNPLELTIADGQIFITTDPYKKISIGEAVLASKERVGQAVYGKGHYEPEAELLDRSTGMGNISEAYTFSAQAVEVELDEETGTVKPLRIIAAHDCGYPINPTAVEGQIEGAVAQGLGYALMENHSYDNGRVLNDTLVDYKIPTAMDVPPIKALMLGYEPKGPFGAKGVGEPGLVGIAPAVANAIFNATGVQIKTLPLSPEKVYWELKKD
jgi:4-hydroxybenzoyl-CoA reductase alpha subunit